MAIIKLNNNALTSVTALPSGVGSDPDVKTDLARLGLRVFANQNLAKQNSNSASYDVFQDDSGIDNETNTDRNASEYVSSITISTNTADAGGTLVESGSLGTSESSDWFTPQQAYGNTTYHALSSAKVELGRNQSYNFSMLYRSALVGDIVFGALAHNNFSGNADTWQTGLTTNTGNSNIFATPSGSVNGHASNWNVSNFGDNYIFTWQGAGSNKTWKVLKNGSQLATGTHTFTQSENTTSDTRIFAQRVGTTLSFAYQEGSSGARTKFYTLSSSEFNSSANMYGIFSADGGQNCDCNWFASIRHGATSVKGETSTVASATGSFTGTTITAGSSTTKMGAVITYQDASGTNALNSDLVLKLSADNGSNYSTATLTALPDFSSGVKCCSVADLSVTAGTQLKYKIEFANQSSGSKECRVTGVSLQY